MILAVLDIFTCELTANNFDFFRRNIRVLGVLTLFIIVAYRTNGGMIQDREASYFLFLPFLLLEEYVMDYFAAM